MRYSLLLIILQIVVSAWAATSLPDSTSLKTSAPSGLMVDLIAHPDRVYADGYLSSVTLSERSRYLDRTQVAEIHSAHPMLSWVVNGKQSSTLQIAYQVRVATSQKLLADGEQPDVWESGKVLSNQSSAVRMGGNTLQPSADYYWQVRTWDNHGQESDWSAVQMFATSAVLDEIPATCPLCITDQQPALKKKLNEHTLFFDFEKAAFGKLRVTLATATDNDTAWVRMGEVCSGGRLNRRPGGSRRYAEYKLPLQKGCYTYDITIHRDGRNTSMLRDNESGVLPVFMPDYIGEVYPFRYVEVEQRNGFVRNAEEVKVLRQMVTYPFDEEASSFTSSDTVLNKVWELCKYSIQATSFCGTYVDGDRERIPYEADALINQLSHYAVDREYSMARYSYEYLVNNPTWPTEWCLQTLILAWNDYLYTGDTVALSRHYEVLKAKCLLPLQGENGLLSTRTGKMDSFLYQSIRFRGKTLRDIVDWPQDGEVGTEKERPGEADGYERTEHNAVVNAFYFEALRRMAQIAEALHRTEEARMYGKQAEKLGKTFHKLFFDKAQGCYRDGLETSHTSLHASMMAFAFGLVPEAQKERVIDYIQSRRMACSVYGAQFLLDALYEAHRGEYALSLLTATGDRSWYNMIRSGSTVTTEAWDNKYKPNQDWNHAWGAVPANVIPRGLLGIVPLQPAFELFRIKPQLGRLKEVNATFPTIRGAITVTCVQEEINSKLTMNLNLPVNTTAEIWFPCSDKHYKPTVDGEQIKGKWINGFYVFTLGSGKHCCR